MDAFLRSYFCAPAIAAVTSRGAHLFLPTTNNCNSFFVRATWEQLSTASHLEAQSRVAQGDSFSSAHFT